RLAIELGMNEEAEVLLKNCQRFDLLNIFYQSTDQWGKHQLSIAITRNSFHTPYAVTYVEVVSDPFPTRDFTKEIKLHFFLKIPQTYAKCLRYSTNVPKPPRKLRKWWAQYMESTGEMDVALKFYQQAADPLSLVRVYCYCGNLDKAAEVANETGDRAACYHLARQFENNDEIKQAIHFFTRAMAFGNAIRICKEHGFEDQLMNLALLSTPNDMIEAARHYEDRPDTLDKAINFKLTEDLVEKLTIPKDFMDQHQRERLLSKLAGCCMNQGEYHLACKKYTQAGDKEKAMRALLKSGDTEKIIFFAGVSRMRNLYVMAANYLQSLDWRKDPEIMKNIISFYTKGRALDSLAGFYDACAQVEIDEYQNYEKAMGALTEAFKCLTKAKMANKQQQESKITELKSRIALVKKFIQTRRLFDSDPQEGIKQCHALLGEQDLESSVRFGDVYGLLIEYCASQGNHE
uniref:Uncharacterized protein n=1 Tax=Ciona savignyi TaxID=51511 RepID=H2Z486_CIOSA